MDTFKDTSSPLSVQGLVIERRRDNHLNIFYKACLIASKKINVIKTFLTLINGHFGSAQCPKSGY